MSTLNSRTASLTDQAVSIIDKIFSMPGLKALLCDDETKNMLSICYSQHQLLRNEVVFVDMLNNDRGPMPFLYCIILCRPTSNVSSVVSAVHFSGYEIYFTGMISNDILTELANADIHSKVTKVEEVCLDITPLGENVCVIPLQPSAFESGNNKLANPVLDSQWRASDYERMVDGLVSIMLLMERRPVIRYRAKCQVAEKLAEDLTRRMRDVVNACPDVRCQDCVLLICDRMDDPCTPLLMQWSYEAMIHELIGIIDGNKVDLGLSSKDCPEPAIILKPEFDNFFADNRYSDWGKTINSVRVLVEECKSSNALDQNASLEQLLEKLKNVTETTKVTQLAFRHTLLASKLNDEVKARNLLQLSELEQQFMMDDSHSIHSEATLEHVKTFETELADALRLTILYNLRYETHNNKITEKLKQELIKRGCSEKKIELIDQFEKFAGSKHRNHSLFNTNVMKSIIRSLTSQKNYEQSVYMRHTPLLKRTINRLYNGQLNDQLYPVKYNSNYTAAQALTMRAKDIIIVMPGGASLEETRLVHNVNVGQIDNEPEMMRPNFARIVQGANEATGNSHYNMAGTATSVNHTRTKKIEARVILATPAIVNSSQFIRSVLGNEDK